MKYNLIYHCPCCGKETVIFSTEDTVVSLPVIANERGDLPFACEHCNREGAIELKKEEK